MPTINISMTEAQEWKLRQLQRRTRLGASYLMRKGLLLLVSELESFVFPEGQMGHDTTEADLEKEYAERTE